MAEPGNIIMQVTQSEAEVEENPNLIQAAPVDCVPMAEPGNMIVEVTQSEAEVEENPNLIQAAPVDVEENPDTIQAAPAANVDSDARIQAEMPETNEVLGQQTDRAVTRDANTPSSKPATKPDHPQQSHQAGGGGFRKKRCVLVAIASAVALVVAGGGGALAFLMVSGGGNSAGNTGGGNSAGGNSGGGNSVGSNAGGGNNVGGNNVGGSSGASNSAAAQALADQKWQSAPSSISSISNSNAAVSGILAHAGISNTTLAATGAFQPIQSHPAKDDTLQVIAALSSFAGGQTSGGRRLQATVDLLTDLTVKMASDGQDTQIMWWQDGKWQLLLMIPLGSSSSTPFTDIGNLGNSWLLTYGITFSGGYKVVTSVPVNVNNGLIDEGVTIFGSVGSIQPSGPISVAINYLSTASSASPSSVVLKARAKVQQLTSATQVQTTGPLSFLAANLYALHMYLPPPASTKSAFGTVKLPGIDTSLALISDLTLDLYDCAVHILGKHSAPPVSLACKYILLFSSSSSDNGFYGTATSSYSSSGTKPVEFAAGMTQFGDLPWPLDGIAKVTHLTFKYGPQHAVSSPTYTYASLGLGWCCDSSNGYTNGYEAFYGYPDADCKNACSSEIECVAYSVSNRGWCHLYTPSKTTAPTGWTFYQGTSSGPITTVDGQILHRADGWNGSHCMQKGQGPSPSPYGLFGLSITGQIQVGDTKNGGWSTTANVNMAIRNGPSASRQIIVTGQMPQFNTNQVFCAIAKQSSFPCPSDLGISLPGSFQPMFSYAYPDAGTLMVNGAATQVKKGVQFTGNVQLSGFNTGAMKDVLDILGMSDLSSGISMSQPYGSLTSDANRLQIPSYLRLMGPAVQLSITPPSSIFLQNVNLVFISSACYANKLSNTGKCSGNQLRVIHASATLGVSILPTFQLSASMIKPSSSFNGAAGIVFTGQLSQPWRNVLGFTNFHVHAAGIEVHVVKAQGKMSIKGWLQMQLTTSLRLNCTMIVQAQGKVVKAVGMWVNIPQFSLYNVAEFILGLQGVTSIPSWLSPIRSLLQSITAQVNFSFSSGFTHLGQVYPPHAHGQFAIQAGIAQAFCAVRVEEKQKGVWNGELSVGMTNFDLTSIVTGILDVVNDIGTWFLSKLNSAVSGFVNTLVSLVSFAGFTAETSGARVRLCYGLSKGSFVGRVCTPRVWIPGVCTCSNCDSRRRRWAFCTGWDGHYTSSVCTPAVPPSDLKLCTPRFDMSSLVPTGAFSSVINAVKSVIPRDLFKVNKLALSNFSMTQMASGTTSLEIDAKVFTLAVNHKIDVDLSFLQPLLKGLSSWKNQVIAVIKNKAANAMSQLATDAIALTCSTLNKLCVSIAAGAILDFTIDFPSVVNAFISDIKVKFPSSSIGPYCLWHALPFINCNRRLTNQDEPEPRALICVDCYTQQAENLTTLVELRNAVQKNECEEVATYPDPSCSNAPAAGQGIRLPLTSKYLCKRKVLGRRLDLGAVGLSGRLSSVDGLRVHEDFLDGSAFDDRVSDEDEEDHEEEDDDLSYSGDALVI